ncbi:MAG: class I SAM-dependent methyltransferase [Solirubrobacterales bacterium]|nr:class I SAM-dependent methyltransferase [Solirubrobacterales bacterium]
MRDRDDPRFSGAQRPPDLPPADVGRGQAALARRLLHRIAGGRLTALPIALHFWDGSCLRMGSEPVATLLIRGPSTIARLLREPTELGLARAWVTGELDLDGDLDAVLGLRHRLEGVRFSWLDRARFAAYAALGAGASVLRPPSTPAVEARPSGRRHSLARDREAIHHHYDVSNRFYELLLGASMSYSCAAFASPEESLEAAQERKHALICQRLALAAGERLLDIGCGWGSLLLHAVRNHGVRGVGVTLSESQAELARERVRREGLADEIEIRIADYRQLDDGPYDKIASVGMYEHVGASNYDTYIERVRSLLGPGGLFLNDGIARLFATPPRSERFIARYVFPDGEVNPLTALLTRLERAGLEIRGVQSLREDYALTLRWWYSNLEHHRAEAISEVGEQRVRVWEIYTLASAQAFASGELTNYHVLAQRPR